VVLLTGGCTTLTDYGPWGTTISWPDGGRLGGAAVAAIRHPQVWAPLAGAAVIGIADLDDDISDWAVDHTPVFGSDAADASDRLRSFNSAAYWVTAVIVPSDSLTSRVKGMAVGASALVLEEAATNSIKSLSSRQRPNEMDDKSFPSGHTSRASVGGALAAQNLNYLDMPIWTRRTLQFGLHATAAATGWARVEAEKHYPTDVLVGYALGQFVARFMQTAFFGPTPADPANAQPQALAFKPMPGGGEITLTLSLH
jgi:membrane-associated phospholipid phosphatase